MKQPLGFMHPNLSTLVYKLNKYVYGLKQAFRAWFAQLTDRLFAFGFKCSISNFSLFIQCNPIVSMLVLVYVYNIVVTTCTLCLISEFISFISSSFLIMGHGHYTIS